MRIIRYTILILWVSLISSEISAQSQNMVNVDPNAISASGFFLISTFNPVNAPEVTVTSGIQTQYDQNYKWQFVNSYNTNNYYLRTYIDGQGWSEYNKVYHSGNINKDNVSLKCKDLSAYGNIRAHEIKVETSYWPDYVFADDYKISPLIDIASYIKIHKHLPEMPSAQTIAADGVALGEMNKLLVKKIEELTLHLIQKDKELTEERGINKDQEKRIERLESIMINHK